MEKYRGTKARGHCRKQDPRWNHPSSGRTGRNVCLSSVFSLSIHLENPRPQSRMNILIVDDYPNLSRITAIALREMGCRTFTVDTTVAALRLLDTEQIDGVFLDDNLGIESGLDFLSLLVGQPGRPPVVMFTAQPRDEIAAEALRRGAVGCLLKPFSLDDLRQQVERIAQHQCDHSGS